MYISVGKFVTPFTYTIPGCDLFVYTWLTFTLHGKVFIHTRVTRNAYKKIT